MKKIYGTILALGWIVGCGNPQQTRLQDVAQIDDKEIGGDVLEQSEFDQAFKVEPTNLNLAEIKIIPGTVVDRYQKGVAGFEKIVDSQKAPTGYMNIVMIGDGYKTDADQIAFEAIAKGSVDSLFDDEPFKSHAADFNVYLIKASNIDWGVDRTGLIKSLVLKDGGVYARGYVNMAIKDFYKNKNVKVFNELTFLTVVANDSTGRPAVVRGSKTVVLLGNNVNYKEVYRHEMGHAFGLLADEYYNKAKQCGIWDYNASEIGDFGLNITVSPSKPPFWSYLIGKEDGAAFLCSNGYFKNQIVNDKPVTCTKPVPCLVGGPEGSPDKCKIGPIGGIKDIGFAGAGACTDGTSKEEDASGKATGKLIPATAWRGCFLSTMSGSAGYKWCIVNEILLGKMIEYYKTIDSFVEKFNYGSRLIMLDGKPGGIISPGVLPPAGTICRSTVLPKGLTLDIKTCVISGTAIKATPKTKYSVTIKSKMETIEKELYITIMEAPATCGNDKEKHFSGTAAPVNKCSSGSVTGDTFASNIWSWKCGTASCKAYKDVLKK